MGWKIDGKFDPSIKKSVVIVVPHTSWHDFYVGAFTRKIIQVDINYIAKKELFKGPLGAYLKWMGGSPLDRTKGQNKVEAIAQLFEEKEEFRLALAPEGTRKKVLKWKSGFYWIAVSAKVPIIPVAFDYGKKVVKIGEAFYPTGNYDKDYQLLQLFYKHVKGKTDL
ncbi:1-acyl-sn-glycerol-3-phosphate acyltransferase [Mesonia sp.]|uniref:1-acyl-sn-glycerol-3-phosphate acyltransferase n=2 Tax=Mesonia oceanica TaxID=2687242 RepID=A0AC61YE27_9FLAO|nr:1-acyl-sn-glycerol-3-phosphate acyltransferase [Mesonia oceanica]|tara:strand:+ start:60577 stop:61074 length:498 start_codon:yes stop_codon:yes gene_type:complete